MPVAYVCYSQIVRSLYSGHDPVADVHSSQIENSQDAGSVLVGQVLFLPADCSWPVGYGPFVY